MKSITILVLIGTRPEAIKLAPVVKALKKRDHFKVYVGATGQHREMLAQTLGDLGLKADWDLNLMQARQTLWGFSSECLRVLPELIQEVKPHCVVVQGDTSTSLLGALSAFYFKIPVAHVEAGLRTHHRYSPFPEEINRKMLASLSDFHFCPTPQAVENLVQEGIERSRVFQTGNTSIDALKEEWDKNKEYDHLKPYFDRTKTFLITAHRRENFGAGLKGICEAILNLTRKYPQYHFVYPVHPNPEVRKIVFQNLSNEERVFLTEPFDYSELVFALRKSVGVLSDSGGLQEEAPTLGLPILILRKDTERPEAVQSGYGFLAGTEPETIISCFSKLEEQGAFRTSSHWNPTLFGDGQASPQIAEILERYFIF